MRVISNRVLIVNVNLVLRQYGDSLSVFWSIAEWDGGPDHET